MAEPERHDLAVIGAGPGGYVAAIRAAQLGLRVACVEKEPAFDGKRIVSSEEALAFEAVPERLLVIGAGAVGLEIVSVWARLGSRVRVVELMERIVPGMDGDLAGHLRRSLERQGMRFELGASVEEGAVRDGSVQVTIAARGRTSTESFDRVLVAVGRRPYLAGLGLETLGVALDDRGF